MPHQPVPHPRDLRPALLAAALGPPGAWLAQQAGLTLGPAACSSWGFVTLLVLSPLLEEFLFRAGLQAWLLRRWPQRMGPLSLANGLVAVLFAALHLWRHPTPAALLTTLPALLIGWAWERGAQRLWLAVLLHAWFNGGLVWLSCAGL